MFALEDGQNVQNHNGHLKVKNRKHHTTSESSLLLEEDKNLVDLGESHKKKRKILDIKKYNQINEPQNDDEPCTVYNLPNKRKKRIEKANHKSEVLLPKNLINNEFIENDTLDSTDDIKHLNREQSQGLYKNKKDHALELLLDEPTGKHIKREDNDYVKKPKKKRKERKDALLKEDDVVIKSDEKNQNGEISDINNLPKKKKKQIENIAAASEDHDRVSTKYENIRDVNTGQNESHLYKKKKNKKTDDASELLEQPITKRIKSEYDNQVKKSKKKKHKERKVASLQQEEVVIKLEDKKQSKLCDDEKLHDELSGDVNNFPKKSKKKQKDTIEVASEDQESISTLDAEGKNIQVKHTGKNESYLYKQKKKKKKTDCGLELSDQPVGKQIQNEFDEDQVKKRKKKKNKKREVTLVQEEEEESVGIPQVYFANEQTENVDNICVNDCTNPPLKKVKKHKHKNKAQEISVSDCSPKLNKKKHAESVEIFEDTQLSLCNESEIDCQKCDKSTEEDVKTVTHRKNKKRKHGIEINENMQSAHNNVNIYSNKCKKYKTVPPMKEKVGDSDASVIDHIIKTEMSTEKDSSLSFTKSVKSSPELNNSKQRNDTATSESVSNDTFTLEIHEDDTHSILNGTLSSNDAMQDEQHYSDDNNQDVPKRKIIRNEQKENRVDKIAVKEPLSYKILLEQVKDKSQLKENSNQTVMSVTLPWPVPPLHRIETRVCSRPTVEQRAQMKALSVEIKSGIFNKSEDDQIKKNWKEFCQLHDLPDEDLTSFLNFSEAKGSLILSTEERINFVRFLAHGLFNRTLASVYKRFQRLFLANKITTGRFSPEEDEIIKKYMKYTSRRTPYSDLAKILNRDRLAVEKRCKALESKDDSVKWEKENIEEFLKYMLEITGSDSLSALKNREIKSREWKALSKKLGISTTKLQRAWVCTIHPRLFIQDKVSSDSIKIALIKKLIEYNENDWRAVDWERIAKDFDALTGRKLNKFIKDAVHYHVPQDLQNNLGESLRYLEQLISQKKIFWRRTLKKLNINEDSF